MSMKLMVKACPVCGDDSQQARDSIMEYLMVAEGAGVCSGCADRIANAYAKKHSGHWLTWDDEPVPPRYSKKKISQTLRTEVFERDLYRCLRCGTHKDLRADHVVPESAGGETTIENLQTLCAPCNSWKGVKTIDFRKEAPDMQSTSITNQTLAPEKELT